jgi:hypothetical protein
MRLLHERQEEFVEALLDPGRPVPSGLIDGHGRSAVRGFNTYRNNVIVGLTAALKESYPIVARIVGDEFFAMMARQYIREHPPVIPMMLAYGERFPQFIDGFEPAAGLEYLSGVARVEWAWIEAYHAADAVPLEVSALVKRPQADVLFDIHPSLRVVESGHPVFTVWEVHASDTAPHSVALPVQQQDVLIVRPRLKVQVHLLPPGGALVVRTLRSGATLADAVGNAMEAGVDLNLVPLLTLLFQAGAFTSARSKQ